ncbi:MAG: class I mannose-6-phosphate isomerase [Microbacterium sp.]
MTVVDHAPVLLTANQPDARPYRGGAGIARFRGTTAGSPYTPEDFVASTTEVFAGGVGLTVLPDGRVLRDAVAADPVAWLGEDHVRAFGADTGLLVKLLNTGERLFVHFHPDDAFAQAHLRSPRGKTEAWIVLDVDPGVEGYAALAFARDVSETEVAQWFRGQDREDMLGAMNRVPLAPGDTLLVPAGYAHAIGSGITLLELQQPTDLSVLLEWSGYNGLTERDALLGLDPDIAFGALHRRRVDAERLEVLASRRGDGEILFPHEADRFFGATRLVVDGERRLEQGFSVVVVASGSGRVDTDAGSVSVQRGSTVLVPHGAGPATLSGTMVAFRCAPPRPA